ncbi:MAG TPA: GNAT family protein [Archangium sp.]|uniref:GNAT family N-acetyltransferase n=1 Tax=Archangium sp. TaxID=1872627 RepID=UPI002E35F98E|nr:GNAT family protein [Archangium sp.]HEX5751301.1 GNAT family protein [Archangium sp.]
MLVGRNFSIRLATVEDAAFLADWFSNPENLGKFYNVWPTTRMHWEQTLSERPGPRERGGVYLAIHPEFPTPVGVGGYFNPFTLWELFRGVELWGQIHPQFRGRGVGTQAACLMINHLFNALPLERVQATIVVGNEPSCRAAEAIGMRKEGIYRNVSFLHGRYMDMYLYSIIRADWQSEEVYRQGRPPF